VTSIDFWIAQCFKNKKKAYKQKYLGTCPTKAGGEGNFSKSFKID